MTWPPTSSPPSLERTSDSALKEPVLPTARQFFICILQSYRLPLAHLGKMERGVEEKEPRRRVQSPHTRAWWLYTTVSHFICTSLWHLKLPSNCDTSIDLTSQPSIAKALSISTSPTKKTLGKIVGKTQYHKREQITNLKWFFLDLLRILQIWSGTRGGCSKKREEEAQTTRRRGEEMA